MSDIKEALQAIKNRPARPLQYQSTMSEGSGTGEWPSQPFNDMPERWGESIHSYNQYEHDEY